MRTLCLLALGLLFSLNTGFSQEATLEVYVFEDGNRGYLNLAKVTILDNSSKAILQQTATNMEGVAQIQVPLGRDFLIRIEKDLFKIHEELVSSVGKNTGDKIFLKARMQRKPGYIFDVTIAEKSGEDMPADAVQGARIDVYNNTSEKEVMVLENHPNPTFKTHFEEGNHYTILIRKKGFFNKRLEAFVNVKGCILCFEGVGNVRPSDVLTEGHSMGTLLANVELLPIEVGKGIKVENIYYDYNKADIRKDAAEELDNLITVLNTNPSLLVELGSHTDSRGRDSYNLELSQKRARSAVKYILDNSNIAKHRVTARGYGETQIINKCKNDVKCREQQHEVNRRTELKIVGFLDNDPFANKSLAEIIEEEKFEKMLAEVGQSEVYRVPESGAVPADLARQLEKEKEVTTYVAPKPSEPEIRTPNPSRTNPVADLEKAPVYVPATPAAPIASKPTPKVEPQPNPRVNTTPSTPVRTGPPTVSTTTARPGTKKPYKPKTEEELRAADFTNTPEGFEESITADIGGSNSKIITEVPVASTNRLKGRVLSLPAQYTGYRIEFFNAPFELPASHAIFSKHGNITMEQKKDGSYAYLMGDFEDWRDANKFLTNILLSRYPDARVIRYKKGNRLVR